MTSQFVEEVYSLLIPLADGKLILPRLTVAEIMGYGQPRPMEDTPEWLLGTTIWEGCHIPQVSFEGLCGKPVPERNKRTRLAVIFTSGEHLRPPVFALLTQGYPYLVRVTSTLLSVDIETSVERNTPVLSRVRLANERPMIPDLEAIEARVVDALGRPRG